MPSTAEIPQPRPLPVLGNLLDIDLAAPIQSFVRLARAHGGIFRLALGGRILTLVSDHALVDELCDEARFRKKVHKALWNVRDFAGDGLFTVEDHEPNWAKAHRMLMPAFGPLGIRGMFGRMLDIAEQMTDRWERFGPDAAIDVSDNMTRLTLDTIALCAFDTRFNSFYLEEMHPFITAMVGAMGEAGMRARRPSIATRVMRRTRQRYTADIALMHRVVDTLIADRRRTAGPARHDLLQVMLDGTDPVTGETLSDENIRYQIVTFLIAGHETASGLLSFTLHLLLQNPAILRHARDTVDAVLGGDTPGVDDLPRLRYLDQVLMEALRLWPTAPAFAVSPREPTTLGGRFPVAPTDTLLVLTPMLHRDTAVWGDDPEAFRPDRFAPAAAEALPPNAWKPFGNGARACIGRGFAMQEAVLVLALVLQRFDIAAADPEYRLQVVETLTMKPEGFRIHARRRDPLPPRQAAAPAAAAAPPATPVGDGARSPLLVLFGSNTGSSEAFARRLADAAAAEGYAASVAPMDAHAGSLPDDAALVLVTASYEGQPPDNARRFLSWVEDLAPGTLANRRFAVFGCGNRQWARTYQEVPRRTDAALAAAGAVRVLPPGEADAAGDFFGGFTAWQAALWPALNTALGRRPAAATAEPGLSVEVLRTGREATLLMPELGEGRVEENRELVDTTSPLAQSVRHLEIALPPGSSYRAGDYLAVLPRNPAAAVERALRRFGLSFDTAIMIRSRTPGLLPVGTAVRAGEVLADYVELAQPASRAQLDGLVAATRCPPDRAALAALADAFEAEVLRPRVSLLDLLERFPACELDFAGFLAALPPMRPRQYSISSSPLRDPGRCSLSVAVLDAPAFSGQARHRGVASGFLAGLEPGARFPVAVRPSPAAFHLPDAATPIVMVCAGSGIAPFHGFLQERAIRQAAGDAVGEAMLFFGARHPDVDFLYRDTLAAWEAQDLVRVHTAFSRGPERAYVQDRLWQQRAAVMALIDRGAAVFVCGNGERMAPAVRATFIRMREDAAGASAEAAEAWLSSLERDSGRYTTDAFV